MEKRWSDIFCNSYDEIVDTMKWAFVKVFRDQPIGAYRSVYLHRDGSVFSSDAGSDLVLDGEKRGVLRRIVVYRNDGEWSVDEAIGYAETHISDEAITLCEEWEREEEWQEKYGGAL